ncbi:hypothetical protein [Lysobacter arvi]|uniref:Uncharacterized protein n=1 Tax=Lysobacter arvi TaxID=3038776 RepID=A0ABU1CAB0_9GAMM|nr:hypothetical protein [Lysobacter arvi]MDR0182129.1 hypothetical protein [Lysobacter arvi]
MRLTGKSIGSMAVIALLAASNGCRGESGAAERFVRHADHHPLLKLILEEPTAEGFAKVALMRGDVAVRVLAGNGIVYLRESPPNLSPSGQIALLTQVDQGLVRDSEGGYLHDRASCVFISLRDACVVAKETGLFCGGSWAENDTWIVPDGTTVDLNGRRLSKGSVSSKQAFIDDADIASSLENLRLCDPKG